MREGIAVKPGGPFALSDDAREVAQHVLAQAALAGSYASTPDFVLLNVGLIDVETGLVLASHDTAIPVDANEQSLMGYESLTEYGWDW